SEFILFRIYKLLERIKRCTAVIFRSFHQGKGQKNTFAPLSKNAGNFCLKKHRILSGL
ncbi:MAG: hypothetical protein ACI94Y_003717, partial [Maribacter sp.]